ncbi:hypothetical protein [Mesorhizobium xinjiangense]|nr:hypothetical protein [Mesorhizobium xinjiangense]
MNMNRWISILAVVLAILIIVFFLVPSQNEAPTQSTATTEESNAAD